MLGSYLALGEGAGQKVRLDLRLQDTRNGEVVASASETRAALRACGSGHAMPASCCAASWRRHGGGRRLGFVRGSVPEGAEAARNYSEGLERLRTFDTLARARPAPERGRRCAGARAFARRAGRRLQPAGI